MSSFNTDRCESVFQAIHQACLDISQYIRNYNSSGGLGEKVGSQNASQDDVKDLDIRSQEIIIERLMECPYVVGYASEELPDVVWTNKDSDGFFVVFDPLDGSSNIDVNLPIGTIFGVFPISQAGEGWEVKEGREGEEGKREEGKRGEGRKGGIVLNGRDMCLAGYALYGAMTQILVGKKWEGESGQCSLWTEGSQRYRMLDDFFKEKDKYYSINESNRNRWPEWIHDWVLNYEIGNGKTLRWIGCLVADGHRTLCKGGMFAYPGDSKNKHGKLRLVYEAFPFALIFSIAGGKAIDNDGVDILEKELCWDNIHQKTGLFLGDSEIIQKIAVYRSTNK